MTINTLPGLRKALNLLDAFSTEREPSEVLVEFRKQLTGEIDDNLPAVSDVQAWAERMLYQTEGQVEQRQFTDSANALLNMQVWDWIERDYPEHGVHKRIEFVVACSKRRIKLTLEDALRDEQGKPIKVSKYRLTKINVEE